LSVAAEHPQNSTLVSYKREKALLFTGVMIFGIGQSMLFVVFGPLARSMGLSEIQFGLIFTLSNLGLVIAGPYWGRASDRLGRKKVFMIGLSGTMAGTFSLALAIQVGLWGLLPIPALMALLFCARCVYSLTAIAVYPASSAFMADITDRATRAQGMALIGGANSMGSVLGPAIGAGLATIHVLFPMYTASALALAGVGMAALWLVEPPRHEASTTRTTLKITDKRILPFMLMWLTFFTVFTTLQFVSAFYIQDQFGVTDQTRIMRTFGLAMFSLGASNVVIQVGLFQIIRVRPSIVLRFCFPALAAGLLLLAFTKTLYFMFPAYMCIGLAFSCANPGISGGASLSVEPHEQGAASGLLSAATTSGVILGPLLGTSLYKISHTLPMFIGAALALAMATFTFFVRVPDPGAARPRSAQ